MTVDALINEIKVSVGIVKQGKKNSYLDEMNRFYGNNAERANDLLKLHNALNECGLNPINGMDGFGFKRDYLLLNNPIYISHTHKISLVFKDGVVFLKSTWIGFNYNECTAFEELDEEREYDKSIVDVIYQSLKQCNDNFDKFYNDYIRYAECILAELKK